MKTSSILSVLTGFLIVACFDDNFEGLRIKMFITLFFVVFALVNELIIQNNKNGRN